MTLEISFGIAWYNNIHPLPSPDMGNLLSSAKNTEQLEAKTKKLESENAKLQATIETLRTQKGVSPESVTTLQREVVAQKKTIALLKTAAREMIQSDNVCASTKKELERVVEENNDLVADMKTANEKHKVEVERLTNEKMEAMKQLEKELKRTETNNTARTALETKLRQSRLEVQTCLDREKELKKGEAKLRTAQTTLLRERTVLYNKVRTLTATVGKVDDLRVRQAKAFSEEARVLRAKRPIAMDRINNASESVTVSSEALKVSFANIDVKPGARDGVASAQGVLVVMFRMPDNRMQSATIRFSGNAGLNIHDTTGKTIVAANLQKGPDVTRVLAESIPNFTIKAARTPLLRNGWSFTFSPPPQGGLFTRATLAVEGGNEWYGLSGVQIAEVDPAVPRMRLGSRFQRKTSAPPALAERKPAALPKKTPRTTSSQTINPRFRRS